MNNDDTTVSRSLFEALLILLLERDKERDALRDMLDDVRGMLSCVREALGVAYEPHQTLDERTLEAARAAGKLLGERNGQGQRTAA